MPVSIAMTGMVMSVGPVLCGNAWTRSMAWGWSCIGLFGVALGAFRVLDEISIDAGKGTLVDRWEGWFTRHLPLDGHGAASRRHGPTVDQMTLARSLCRGKPSLLASYERLLDSKPSHGELEQFIQNVQP